MTEKNKEIIFYLTSIAANLIIVASATILVSYIIIYLLGGKLFLYAIFKCVSWSGIALGIKIAMNRAAKGLQIRAREYLLLCLLFVFNVAVWFPFPSSLFLIFLGIIGLILSYKHKNRDAKM